MSDNKGEVWPIDGKDHKDVGARSIYRNSKIRLFLETEQRTILIAAKGMGKTLLLRSKKQQLENSTLGHLIIPRDLEFDYPQLRGSISIKGLESEEVWRDLWSVCIIFSVISHRFSRISENISDEPIWEIVEKLNTSHSFKETLLSGFIKEESHPPSYYLCLLLELGVGWLRKFIRSSHHVDIISHHYITSSTCIFIDAFDQTLTDNFSQSLKVWRNAQNGLIHAVHRLNNSNRHIKVYVSIRQEAWAAFKSDDREVIKGQSIILEYDKKELGKMFLHGVQRYSGFQSIKEFIGLEHVENGRTKEPEKLFDYIYRHSVSSPRSIMAFGLAIHESEVNDLTPEDRMIEFRRVVNEAGAEHLYQDYLISQRKIFLETLNSEKNINELLKLLPSNVLRGKTLASINKEFSKNKGIIESESHPFCELFNIGIIGSVRRDPVTTNYVQEFKKPHEFDWEQYSILNEKMIYLIHPSLHKCVSDHRGDDYYLNPRNIIGSGRDWKSNGKKVFPLIFISHSSDDKARVEPLMDTLESNLDLIFPCDMWYDKDNIRAGGDIHAEVERGVENSEFVVVFISKSSLDSGWVDREWRDKHAEGIEKKQVSVICCLLDSTKISDLPRTLQGKKMMFLNRSQNENEIEVKRVAVDIGAYLRTWST